MQDRIVKRDLQSIWHPCSQMKDYENFPPLLIQKAKGAYMISADTKKYFDAISGWWCKSLGHGHPRLKQALRKQVQKYEHIISANTVNETLVELSERLLQHAPFEGKVFYAGDGSTAVEIAVKMSLHSRQIQKSKKFRLAGLQSSYHGETLMCLSLSDLSLYSSAYQNYLHPTLKIQDIPYLNSATDALWKNAELSWNVAEKSLTPLVDELSAIIVEPIVQGAGGMKIYSPDFLRRLSQWCRKNDVHLIADEIMTGMGRTGEFLAMDHSNSYADFICLSKGLTSGFMAFSAVLVSNEIYHFFYDDYEMGKSFLHSNTYSGNALAASVALELLKIYEDEQILTQVNEHSELLKNYWFELDPKHTLLENKRHIGFITAAELTNPKNIPRYGYQFFKHALKYGVFMRPLGNTMYWLPPLNTTKKDLKFLFENTHKALKSFS